MKRILLLLIAVFLMAGCSGGSAGNNENYKSSESTESSANRNRDDNCVYNNFYWGDDKEYVIAEKGEPVSYRPDNSIEYNESFIVDDCRTYYYFDEDWALNKIRVIVDDTFMDYDDTKNMLIEMYGEPLSDKTDEDNFEYLNWSKGNTDIELCIINGLPGYTVDYLYKAR